MNLSSTTPVDLARVRVATEDHAAGYFGGPLHLGQSDAARYVSEGHLSQYPLRETWAAVAAYIREHPDVLRYTPAERKARQAARAAECDRLAEEAWDATQREDYAAAASLIDRAKLVDPDHRVAGRHTWSDIRAVILKRTPGGAA